MKLKRRMAMSLAAHMRWIMPKERASWALGMESELHAIEEDGAALRWAAGALFAAYLERATTLCASSVARVLVTVPILFQAFGAVFAPCLILAWRSNHLGLAALLGSRTPGDDYRRFVPLLEMLPGWYVALGMLAGVLFLLSAVQLLRRRRSALGLFGAGLAVELLGEGLVRLLPGYAAIAGEVFSFPQANFRRDVLIPAATSLLPVLLGLMIWLAQRSQSPGTPDHLARAD